MKMTNINSLGADAILDIPEAYPERLFDLDRVIAKQQWRTLSSHWHPDRNSHPRAQWVFSHIQALFEAASSKQEQGIWVLPNSLMLSTTDDRQFRLRYNIKQNLDVGTAYVGHEVICYLLNSEFSDLAIHANSLTRNLVFADAAMEASIAPLLPRCVACLKMDGGIALVGRKSADFVPLTTVLKYAGGALESRHVAWIVSGLLNLTCYLESAGLAHHAIEVDHLLIAPQQHAVALAGGWWYATRQNSPLQALPARSIEHAPQDVLRRKRGDVRLDQFLSRITAIELLGDLFDAAPFAMKEFLQLPPERCAVADYERWQQVLWDSFGERRFTPLAITPDDIYEMAS